MTELFSQLGINGKLLLAQAVNFGVVLIVLTFVVYRPLVRVIEDRRRKIELGLHSAEIAEERLGQIEKEKVEKLAEADRIALRIVGDAEKRGAERTVAIVREAEQKSEETLKSALRVAENRKVEELDRLTREANTIMKEAIIKAVEADPAKVDEKLIKRAADIMKKRIATA